MEIKKGLIISSFLNHIGVDISNGFVKKVVLQKTGVELTDCRVDLKTMNKEEIESFIEEKYKYLLLADALDGPTIVGDSSRLTQLLKALGQKRKELSSCSSDDKSISTDIICLNIIAILKEVL